MPRLGLARGRGRKHEVDPSRRPHILKWLTIGPHPTGDDRIEYLDPISQEELIAVWSSDGQKLTRQCKRRDPDKRVWGWWEFIAKEPRKQIRESRFEVHSSELWFGIPYSFRPPLDEFSVPTSLRCSSLHEVEREGFCVLDLDHVQSLIEEHVANFESQLDYLRRLDLE